MTEGALLDSHTLLWIYNGEAMRPEALVEVTKAAQAARLFASQISIWEMGVAVTKKRMHLVPNLGGMAPGAWFAKATLDMEAQALPISAEIAEEAALVPAVYGYGDPGDCFLIATARIHNLALVTRDSRILKLSEEQPAYLSAVPC